MSACDIVSLGELFEQVQMRGIFPDCKTFVDSIPDSDLSSIQRRYESQKGKFGFDLSAFVREHFTPPQTHRGQYVSAANRPLKRHIDMLWDELTRRPEAASGSLIPLPHPYVVPGGRFREVYYWDSYFTMLGLRASKRVDMIQFMVDNFSHLIDRLGYIPNGNRTYYVGRSQPPFYACMVNLLSEEKGPGILADYLPQLEKERGFWMRGGRTATLSDGAVLNRYWDESDTPRPESFKEDVTLALAAKDKKRMYRNLRAAAESGWDFSSRWFKSGGDFSSIHTTDIIPVDLNCLLLNLEQTLAQACRLSHDDASSARHEAAAARRKETVNKYCWNERRGFYFDYDFIAGSQKTSLSLAGVYPLFFEAASKKQATAVARTLRKKFLHPGGLTATTEATDQQWDAPNGWAPLHWMAVRGLAKYGHVELARDVAARWMRLNEKVYRNTGKLMEKYNVVATDLEAGGGEYPGQDGFGWTNGVYLALDAWLGE